VELMSRLYGIWPTVARNSAYTIKESYLVVVEAGLRFGQS